MKSYVERSMTYSGYLQLIDDLLAEGKTTGTNQSDKMKHYAELNRQRMKRLEKTIELSPEVVFAARSAERPMIWLTLTEGWCGDAAQNIPVIEKIAAESDIIETRYLLRDENLELMDRFLENGSRAIPRLIALDAQSLEVLGTWGSRPRVAQELYVDMRSGGIEKAVILEEMQRWYNADHTESLQAEFVTLINEWDRSQVLSAAI